MRALGVTSRALGALIALSPFVSNVVGGRAAEWLDLLFVGMCHRLPERSLQLFGETMPLCSRCVGLATGFGLGMLVAWPRLSVRTLRVAVTAGALFLLVELTTQDLGWHPVFHPSRLLSGWLVTFPIGAALTQLVERGRLEETPARAV
ncbi:MAG: DUF2085 domain-containing protein [Polyangiaceae bacterium]|nr:DUF2085 domain-containing protein [Polyangiaceae bacterium]